LWSAAHDFRDRGSLTPSEFLKLISIACTASSPPFCGTWRCRFDNDLVDVPGFAGWEACVLRKIVDLHEMEEQSLLRNELRYFGIDSPRGSRWYNFEPCSFLECAAAGFFGGWQPGDATGRKFVPGPVEILGDDGKITACNPQDVPRHTVPIR